MIEFALLKNFYKSVKNSDVKLFVRTVRNLILLLNLLVTPKKDLIIGAAPYHLSIYYLYLLKLKHNVVYYSSWPFWDYSRYPRKIHLKSQLRVWDKFLHNIKTVAVTEAVRIGLNKYTKNVMVIPHCINPTIFNASKRALKNKNQPIKIIYVGRLVPEKGINLLLNLAGILNDQYPELLIEWVVIGDGELKSEVIEFSKQNLNFSYLGSIKDNRLLANIYNDADILLLPSVIGDAKWEELFGIVLIEAMACGCVPIATASIGPAQIIDQNRCGILIQDAENKNEFLDAIISLLNDEGKREGMAKEAIKKVEAFYTEEINSELWSEVLTDSLMIADNKAARVIG